MAKKGKEKNTKNKAKHSKLMVRKRDKLKKDKDATAARKKALIQKFNEQQKESN